MKKIIGLLGLLLAGTLYAADISGTITDNDSGDALAGATVILLQGGSGGGGTPIDTTTTDDNGQYSFTDLETGGHRVNVTADGYAPGSEFVRLQNADTTVTLDFALAAAVPGTGSITGTITDSQTEDALEGATVTLETGGGNSQVIETTTSGTDGSYSFEGLDAGTYTVAVTMTDYSTASQGGIEVADSAVTADIAMSPVVKGNATITVTDAADDSLLAGADVNIRYTSGGADGAVYTGTTDDSGQVTFSDIEVGDYSVTVVMTDYVTQTGNFSVAEGETQTLTITMDAVTNEVFLTVSGVVQDAEGNSIPDATVTLRTGGGGGGGGLTLVATTDADGAYSITGIPENVGGGTITVTADGYETASEQLTFAGTDQQADFALNSQVVGIQAVSVSSVSISFGPGRVLILDNLQNAARLTIHTVNGTLIENRMVDQGRQMVPLNRIASRTVLFISLQNGVNSLRRTMFVP
jgi:hypothetical protein